VTDERTPDEKELQNQVAELQKQLSEVESRYKAILESQNIYICRFLPGGQIRFTNQSFKISASKLWEQDTSGTNGENRSFIDFLGKEKSIEASKIASLNPDQPEYNFTLTVRAKDGKTSWQQWTCHGFFDPNGNLLEVQAIGHDITALKQGAIAVEQHNRELSALHKATQALLTTLDSEALLGQILDAAIGAVPEAQKGTLHLIARDTGQLELRASRGYTDPRIKKFSYSEATGYVARAVRERRPLIYYDAAGELPIPRKELIPEMSSIRSVIVAPLILQERILGALSLESPALGAFIDSDLRLLVNFAVTATNAIHNAELHSEAQKSAITDALTGLYNRRGFYELGQREIERSFRFKHPLTAVMIDVDHFKYINDTYGHFTGDQVLRHIAGRVTRQLRKVDILARYGGDEFILLLPETHIRVGGMVAERLRRSVSETQLPTEQDLLQVSISLGIAGLTTEITNLEALVQRADSAMYTAKQAGRNRIIPQ